jgi:hypothetical protein
MIRRKLSNSGARVGVWLAAMALLVCGVRCQGDPLYLGPIEISGSIDTEPYDSGGGSSLPMDGGLEAGATDSGPMSDASDVEGGMADAGDASLTCTIPATEPPPRPLPFPVDSYFAPSGWAGDAANGGLVMPACDRDRDPAAVGTCHLFEYTPIPAATAGSASWAGVFFQYPVSNWGAQTGLPIEPGARRVSFLAAGATGGEIVTFRAGGIGDPVAGTCADEFDRDITVRLTDEFERYEIDISDVQYTRVISAFSWKISKVLFTGQTPEPISFYLDDLKWE